MGYLIKYFIKRLPREGFRSLSVSALALALVLLISVMGGMKARMESEYDYMIDSHPIFVEVSDGYSIATDGLDIGVRSLSQFTDPEAIWSVHDYVEDLLLKRELDIIRWEPKSENGLLLGVADSRVITDEGMEISYYEGYDDSIFTSFQPEERLLLVRDELLELLPLAEGGTVLVEISLGAGWTASVFRAPFTIAGTVSGRGAGMAFCSYDMLDATLRASDGIGRAKITVDGREVFVGVRRLSALVLEPSPPETWPLIGITAVDAHSALSELSAQSAHSELSAQSAHSHENSSTIVFYEGYDESVFTGNEYVCLVSEDILGFTEGGMLDVMVKSKAGVHPAAVNAMLTVAGTVKGLDEPVVYVPFQTAGELGFESDGGTPYTERLRAKIADNRELDAFKEVAMRSFTDVGVHINERTFAMTIYDGEFYDRTEALLQTIFFIDIATPFVYFITICVGFVASFLLTRRRRAEFAIMRSVGVNRLSIFFGTLFEQAALCALGAVLGCAIFALTWGYVFVRRPLVFLACYTLGAVISAAMAAGTDVLRLLRDKE